MRKMPLCASSLSIQAAGERELLCDMAVKGRRMKPFTLTFLSTFICASLDF